MGPVQTSLPLDDVAPDFFKRFATGRYFNGSIGVSLSLMNGKLVALLESAEVNGKPVPEQFLDQMRNRNLFADARVPKKIQDFLAGARSLVVEDGKVIVEK